MLPMMFLGLRKPGNICCGHIFGVPDTKFVSATNVARAGKQGNICVRNNVSATMCPRLPGPLQLSYLRFIECSQPIAVENLLLIETSNVP